MRTIALLPLFATLAAQSFAADLSAQFKAAKPDVPVAAAPKLCVQAPSDTDKLYWGEFSTKLNPFSVEIDGILKSAEQNAVRACQDATGMHCVPLLEKSDLEYYSTQIIASGRAMVWPNGVKQERFYGKATYLLYHEDSVSEMGRLGVMRRAEEDAVKQCLQKYKVCFPVSSSVSNCSSESCSAIATAAGK